MNSRDKLCSWLIIDKTFFKIATEGASLNWSSFTKMLFKVFCDKWLGVLLGVFLDTADGENFVGMLWLCSLRIVTNVAQIYCNETVSNIDYDNILLFCLEENY